jgi:uncharacterized protein
VPVSEAGASVYSASEVAREEFPDLDLTLRGAISIARRLQDPLAELVKIDPKAIGVGQYQHDVYPAAAGAQARPGGRELREPRRRGPQHGERAAAFAGRGAAAERGGQHRRAPRAHGPFTSRARLLDVPGLGPRTFEQAAGFLADSRGRAPARRERGAPGALLAGRADRDGPRGRAARAGRVGGAGGPRGGRALRRRGVGEPTLRDILGELQKPGRDPRDRFDPPKFRADITTIADLTPGLELEGVVTNVTAFGAFVDVGVHQDGLVHISQLSDRFVKDPHSIVKPGDRLKVRVLEVDAARKRISLTARLGDKSEDVVKKAPAQDERRGPREPRREQPSRAPAAEFTNNPFARLRRS